MFSLRFAESEQRKSAGRGLFQQALGKSLGFIAGLVVLFSVDVIAFDRAISRELLASKPGLAGVMKRFAAAFSPR